MEKKSIRHVLVPIHLDALLLQEPDTVLQSSVDFSKLPYRDRASGLSANADVRYSSQGVVAPPFRGKTLRLGAGVHLHWAMPDALTQGVRMKDRLEFPALPDRWLVSRRNRATGETECSWIVESDYLHPEAALEDTPPADTVTFPVPPMPGSPHGQPFRYMGRSWETATQWPTDLKEKTEYFNSLADKYRDDPEAKAALSAGLTALGYGDPAFAAFFPNCRSVFGFHDKKTKTAAAFKKVSYDVIGWYDQPEERDPLRVSSGRESTPLKRAMDAQSTKHIKEHIASGHTPADPDPQQHWLDAFAHHFGWSLTLPEGPQIWPATRLICHGAVRSVDGADFASDPAVRMGDVDLAIGNTASEALSAALAREIPGTASRTEEQLEALDLGRKLSHRRLDIGPKFKEARHDRGFKAVPGGRQFTIQQESQPKEAEETGTDGANKSRVDLVLPQFLYHNLNRLNQAQRAFEVGEEEIASLRAQIYRDWTFYMTSLRPPHGLDQDYPDPIEIMRFIDKTGLAQLRATIAETGPSVELDRGDTASPDAPIKGACLPAHASATAKSVRVCELISEITDGLDLANQFLDMIRRFDQITAAKNTSVDTAQPDYPILDTTIPAPSGMIRCLEFSPDGTQIAVAKDAGGSGVYEATTGAAVFELSMLGQTAFCAHYNTAGDKLAVAGESWAGVIDAQNGRQVQPMNGWESDEYYVTEALFSQRGDEVLTSSFDGIICYLDVETGSVLWEGAWNIEFPPLVDDSLDAIANLGSNTDLITFDRRTSASFAHRDPETGDLTYEYWPTDFLAPLDDNGVSEIKALQISLESTWVLSVSNKGDASAANPAIENSEVRLDSDSHRVESACLSADGICAATGGRDGTLKIWSLGQDANVVTSVPLSGCINSVSFSPDNTLLLVACEGGAVVVLDAETGDLLHNLSVQGENHLSTATFDATGTKVAVGDASTGTTRVWRIAGVETDYKDEPADYSAEFGFRIDLKNNKDNRPEVVRQNILNYIAECKSIDDLTYFWEILHDLVDGGKEYAAEGPTQFTLRQLDAPRFYQPNDPVVLITGEGARTTPRHGTDGADQADGKLPCEVLELSPLLQLKEWPTGELPSTLSKVREHLHTRDQEAAPDEERPGLRLWAEQPWHAFAMEWQVAVQPDSEGSNHAKGQAAYAPEFVTQNYTLPEFGVDLDRRSASDATPVATSGLYDGSVILVDHAGGVLSDKLAAFLSADTSDTPKTAQQAANEETLRATAAQLEGNAATLSQSLDGLHEAFVQRHQILQLPIRDPIGPADLAPFTETVRRVTAGRHGNAPLRGRNFTPIRSGVMHLRQLRLIDTFGRVKALRGPQSQSPLAVAQTLAVPGDAAAVALRPRVVQPARLNFRWLSARHADGARTDEAEANAHPALSPICGWILPDLLDSSLSIHDAEGASLGLITAVDGRVVWQPAPGDPDPIDTLDMQTPRLNEHLRTLLRTIISINATGDATFFSSFIDTIANALETIAPEDFSTHRSLALLTARPVAVVRAMVNLEAKGRPAVNESVASITGDMVAAVDPTPRYDPARTRRPRFTVPPRDRDAFEEALVAGDLDTLRRRFDNAGIDLPEDDSAITIRRETDADAPGPHWRIDIGDRGYHVAEDGKGMRVSDAFSRTTDAFGDVHFPIRIGETQQLNDGLIGYFVEEFHETNYCYRDNTFFAPQSAGRVVLDPPITAPDLQALVDQLDVGIVPQLISDRLSLGSGIKVVIEQTSHRWRLDTAERAYSLVRGSAEIELCELLPSSTAHIQTHWKDPVTVEHALDAPPLKLTMLMDPQGSVHAVSGILPTKAITLPKEFYKDALQKIEVSLQSSPILTDFETLQIPTWVQEGYEMTWLTRHGHTWNETAEMKAIDTRAQFASRQRLVDGWIKLRKAGA